MTIELLYVYGAEYRGIVNYYQLAQDVWSRQAALERAQGDA